MKIAAKYLGVLGIGLHSLGATLLWSSESFEDLSLYTPAPKFSILTLDGGGMRGYMQALQLEKIQRLVRKKTGDDFRITEAFDLVAGTSAGAIATAFLTRSENEDGNNRPKYGADDLVNLFETGQAGSIFNRSWWQWLRSGFGFLDEKFSHDPLLALLDQNLGADRKLRDAYCPTVITSYELSIEGSAPYFFKSYENAAGPFANVLARDVVAASGAAPTYFECYSIADASGAPRAFIDGGMTGQNNPSQVALIEAHRYRQSLLKEGEENRRKEYYLLSVGTGDFHPQIDPNRAKSWGLLQWVQPIISIILDAPTQTVDQLLKQQMGQNYARLSPKLDHAIDLANNSPAAMQAMKTVVQAFIKNNKQQFKKIAEILTLSYKRKQFSFE